MTSNHFFIPKGECEGGRAVLRGAEGRHFRKVLRGRPGDEIWLFDEDGVRYRARVESLSAEEVLCALLEREEPREVGTRITLGQALLKAKAMDWVVRKAAEFGAETVAPLTSARSVARVPPDAGRKAGRWTRIVREAAKQSRTAHPPVIEPPRALEEFLTTCRVPSRVVLSERGGARLRETLETIASGNEGRPPSDAVLLIGPEGGWSDREEDAFTDHGFLRASLGRTTLRAETAAVAALAIVAHEWKW